MQQRSWIAFPFAVIKKFGDDQAGALAALIAYYGFFSLFPLLLVLVSILGIVLSGNPELQERILGTALARFPVIGDEIRRNVSSLEGSGVTLAVGIAGTLWAGLGVTQAAQTAMNRVWDIPRSEWPNFALKRVRGLAMLVILGTIVLASTALSGVATSGVEGAAARALSLMGTVILNFVLFMLAYQVLTARELRWRNVMLGAGIAAILWTVLQTVGSFYLTRQLTRASNIYGTFALVIGLLVWLHLGARLALLCAEINVVRERRLWPRSLVQPPLIEGDEQVYRAIVQTEVMRPEQKVSVEFRPSDEDAAESGG